MKNITIIKKSYIDNLKIDNYKLKIDLNKLKLIYKYSDNITYTKDNIKFTFKDNINNTKDIFIINKNKCIQLLDLNLLR